MWLTSIDDTVDDKVVARKYPPARIFRRGELERFASVDEGMYQCSLPPVKF